MDKRTGKIFLFLLLLLLLAGCGKKEDVIPEESNDFYMAEYQIFHMGESAPYLSIFDENGTVYFAGYGENKNGQLYFLMPGDKKPQEIELGLLPETWITGMGYDQGGNLLLACSQYEEGLELLELKKLPAGGGSAQSLDVTNIFKNISGFEAGNIAGDTKGNYYIGDGTKLYMISPEGELLAVLEMESGIEELFPSKEDNLLLARLASGAFVKVDGDKRNVQTLARDASFGNGIYFPGREKELLYTQGDVLYTCDIKDKTPDKVLSWTDCNVNSAGLQSFILLEDGRVAAFSAQSDESGECELALLTKMDKEDMPEKTVVTYGCAFPGSMLYSQIVRFNKTSAKYHIELKQYGEGAADMEAVKNLIRTDILSGNAPDIIDIGAFFSEEERWDLIEAEALEDLNPYFDTDLSIRREDYLEKVLTVYEKDHALYAIMPTFGLYGLVGREADIGQSSLKTLEEMESFYSAHSNSGKTAQGIGRERMLHILCQMNMDQLVDGETGECHFDGEYFTQLLEFAGQFSAGTEQVGLEQTRNGEVLFMEAALMSVADFQRYEYLFGEPVRIIGYPSASGNGLMALPCVSVLAMNGNAENKDGAWQFIRFLLEEDQQEEMGRSGAQGIPVKKTVVDTLCVKQMEAEYEEDGEGNLIEKSKGSWDLGDVVIEYYAITKEEADSFQALLQEIGNRMETDSQQRILDIVQEEANAYFSGLKSAGETAGIIQNRAQNYMKEITDHKRG